MCTQGSHLAGHREWPGDCGKRQEARVGGLLGAVALQGGGRRDWLEQELFSASPSPPQQSVGNGCQGNLSLAPWGAWEWEAPCPRLAFAFCLLETEASGLHLKKERETLWPHCFP